MAQDTAKLLIVCVCGQKMKVPAAALGKSATCVSCGERVEIKGDAAPKPADPIPDDFEPTEESAPAESRPGSDDATNLLLDNKLADEAALADVSLVQRDLPGTTWSILIDTGGLDSQKFHDMLQQQSGAATIDLSNYNVPDDMLTLLPEQLIRERYVIPVDKLGKLLTLAMACPQDQDTVQEVGQITGLRVKPMLCNYEALRETIGKRLRYSKIESEDSILGSLVTEFDKPLNEKIVVRKLFRLGDLGPSRAAVSMLGDVAADDLPGVLNEVLNDPVLTGQLLRHANSGAFGMQGQVDTVGLAGALMGPTSALEALIDLEPVEYAKKHKALDMGAFLKRSRLCAACMKGLAEKMDSQYIHSAQVVGLLFDIGRLVMAEALPGGYAQGVGNLMGRKLYDREMQLYRFPSSEAGYFQLRRWNLPATIMEPVRLQHAPGTASKSVTLTHMLYIAIGMAETWLTNDDLFLGKEYDESLRTLDLKPDDVDIVYRNVTPNF